jgi:hypothetical protein
MSYPLGLTLHAARHRSLRYGRTTLRLATPPRAPFFDTLCICKDTQRNPEVLPTVALGMVGRDISTELVTLPLPRRPLDPGDPSDQVRRWYENVLGWPTVPTPPGTPVRLRVGPRFDVLDVPAEAGRAALRHLTPHSPVAVRGDRMRLLMAAGSAEEVPAVLEWLEWGALSLDLTAIGEGGEMEAPAQPGAEAWTDVRPPAGSGAHARTNTTPGAVGRPPSDAGAVAAVVRHPGGPGRAGAVGRPGQAGATGVRPLPLDRSDAVQGAAVWLRPPEPGGEAEASLPTLSALGGGGDAPDLVRVLSTVATQCHRLWLRRGCAQPSVFS